MMLSNACCYTRADNIGERFNSVRDEREGVSRDTGRTLEGRQYEITDDAGERGPKSPLDHLFWGFCPTLAQSAARPHLNRTGWTPHIRPMLRVS
jgi:hypothetical protein